MKQETIIVSNGDRVLIQRTENEKEIVTVKAIVNQDSLLVRDSSGEIVQIATNQVIKKFRS